MADEQRKLKVEAFYRKYAPTEVSKVSNALSLKVSESELFKMLRDKYKITDTTGIAVGQLEGSPASSPLSPSSSSGNFSPAAAGATAGGGGGEGLAKRARIEAFYRKYAPTEMSKVDNAVKAKISEAELFKMLRERYQVAETTGVANGEPEPEPEPAAAAIVTADPLREKVVAFFQKYAPNDISKVNKTLSFGLPEDELFARLRQKYGVAEDSTTSSTPAPAGASGETYKDRVLVFLEKFAPQDAKKIDKVMGFNLPEEELFARLRQKYDVTPEQQQKLFSQKASSAPTPSSSAAASADDGLRERVKAFLEKHAPADLPRLDKLLSHGLPEDELMARLKAKYGVKEDEQLQQQKSRTNSALVAADSGSFSSSSSVANGSSPTSFRDRVKAFLEKHAPADVGRLDKLLARGLSEDDLMKALRAKYGVTGEDQASPASLPTTTGGSSASSSSSSSLKDKVTAFFEKYAPNEISRVDKAVALGGQVGEEELFKKLREKYGAGVVSPSGAGGDLTSLKEKVTDFFKKHAPNEMARVDKAVALGAQVGEEELFKKLREKYGVDGNGGGAQTQPRKTSEPTSPVTPAASATPPRPPTPLSPFVAEPAVITATTATTTLTRPETPKQASALSSSSLAPVPIAAQPRFLPVVVEVEEGERQQQAPQKKAEPAPAVVSIQNPPPAALVVVPVPHLANPIAVATFVSKFVESQNHKVEELLFSLQQREEAIANREKAIEAREIAFESRCLSLGAEPTRIIFEAAGQQTAEFVAHMVDVESTLAAATADLIRFEKALRDQELNLADRELHLEKKEKLAVRDEEDKKQRLDDRERDVQKQIQRLLEMQATQEAERKRLNDTQRHNADKESDLAGREAKLGALTDSLKQREAALQIQQEATSKEREASRKFSEELLQREGTVRAVERSLNAARAELTRLENDVSLHAKKLLEDQRALRRWSEELERREERFQRKNPNGK